MAALVSSVSPAALAARLAPGRAWIMDRWSIRGPLPVAATAAFSAGGGSGEEKRRRLVLYKKPGCCLCDGLEEKLHAALSLAGGPHSLPSVDLQVSAPFTPLPPVPPLHTSTESLLLSLSLSLSLVIFLPLGEGYHGES